MTDIQTGEHPVVVGVDGSESALHAVRWATREAARRRTSLRLVHVCHLVPVRHPRQVAPPVDYRLAVLDQGRHWLTEAEEAVRHVTPNVAVVADLRDGITADLLIEESRTAQLVVLGSRGLGGFSALLVGSVAIALATMADEIADKRPDLLVDTAGAFAEAISGCVPAFDGPDMSRSTRVRVRRGGPVRQRTDRAAPPAASRPGSSVRLPGT